MLKILYCENKAAREGGKELRVCSNQSFLLINKFGKRKMLKTLYCKNKTARPRCSILREIKQRKRVGSWIYVYCKEMLPEEH